MLKSLIRAIERLALAQEESNQLNKAFLAHRYKQDEESQQYTKRMNEQHLHQTEEMLKLAKDTLRSLNENNEIIMDALHQRLETKEKSFDR